MKSETEIRERLASVEESLESGGHPEYESNLAGRKAMLEWVLEE